MTAFGEEMDPLNSLVQPDLSTETPSWCDNCQKLRQEITHLEEQQLQNFDKLKKKIISTDLLIKKYKSKCEENNAQQKKAEEAIKRAENFQRQSEILESQLKTALLDVEPLRQLKTKLEEDVKQKAEEIQRLSDLLVSSQGATYQYEALSRDSASSIERLEAEKKELVQKVKQLETGKVNKEVTKELKSEISSLKKENSALVKSEARLQKRLKNVLAKNEQLMQAASENKLSPQVRRKRTSSGQYLKSPAHGQKAHKSTPQVPHPTPHDEETAGNPEEQEISFEVVEAELRVSAGDMDSDIMSDTDDDEDDKMDEEEKDKSENKGDKVEHNGRALPNTKLTSDNMELPHSRLTSKDSELLNTKIDSKDRKHSITKHTNVDKTLQKTKHVEKQHVRVCDVKTIGKERMPKGITETFSEQQASVGAKISEEKRLIENHQKEMDDDEEEGDFDDNCSLYSVKWTFSPLTQCLSPLPPTPACLLKNTKLKQDLSSDQNEPEDITEQETDLMEGLREDFKAENNHPCQHEPANVPDDFNTQINQFDTNVDKILSEESPFQTNSMDKTVRQTADDIEYQKKVTEDLMDIFSDTTSEHITDIQTESSLSEICTKGDTQEEMLVKTHEEMLVKTHEETVVKTHEEIPVKTHEEMAVEIYKEMSAEAADKPSEVSRALSRRDTETFVPGNEEVEETADTKPGPDIKTDLESESGYKSSVNEENANNSAISTIKCSDSSVPASALDNLNEIETAHKQELNRSDEKTVKESKTCGKESACSHNFADNKLPTPTKSSPGKKGDLGVLVGKISPPENVSKHSDLKTDESLTKGASKPKILHNMIMFQKSSSGTLAEEIESLNTTSDYDVLSREQNCDHSPINLSSKVLRRQRKKLKKKVPSKYVDMDSDISNLTATQNSASVERSPRKRETSQFAFNSLSRLTNEKKVFETEVPTFSGGTDSVVANKGTPKIRRSKRLSSETCETFMNSSSDKSIKHNLNETVSIADQSVSVEKDESKNSNDVLNEKGDAGSLTNKRELRPNKKSLTKLPSEMKECNTPEIVKEDLIKDCNIINSDENEAGDSNITVEINNTNDDEIKSGNQSLVDIPKPSRQLSTGFVVNMSMERMSSTESLSSPLPNVRRITPTFFSLETASVCDTIDEEMAEVGEPSGDPEETIDPANEPVTIDTLQSDNSASKLKNTDPLSSASQSEKSGNEIRGKNDTVKLVSPKTGKKSVISIKTSTTTSKSVVENTQENDVKVIDVQKTTVSLHSMQQVYPSTSHSVDSDSEMVLAGMSRSTTPSVASLDRTSPLSPLPMSPFDFIIPISPLPPSPCRGIDRVSPLSSDQDSRLSADVEQLPSNIQEMTDTVQAPTDVIFKPLAETAASLKPCVLSEILQAPVMLSPIKTPESRQRKMLVESLKKRSAFYKVSKNSDEGSFEQSETSKKIMFVDTDVIAHDDIKQINSLTNEESAKIENPPKPSLSENDALIENNPLAEKNSSSEYNDLDKASNETKISSGLSSKGKSLKNSKNVTKSSKKITESTQPGYMLKDNCVEEKSDTQLHLYTDINNMPEATESKYQNTAVIAASNREILVTSPDDMDTSSESPYIISQIVEGPSLAQKTTSACKKPAMLTTAKVGSKSPLVVDPTMKIKYAVQKSSAGVVKTTVAKTSSATCKNASKLTQAKDLVVDSKLQVAVDPTVKVKHALGKCSANVEESSIDKMASTACKSAAKLTPTKLVDSKSPLAVDPTIKLKQALQRSSTATLKKTQPDNQPVSTRLVTDSKSHNEAQIETVPTVPADPVNGTGAQEGLKTGTVEKESFMVPEEAPSGQDYLVATKTKHRMAHRPNIQPLRVQKVQLIDPQQMVPSTRKRRSLEPVESLDKKPCKDSLFQRQKGPEKPELRQMQTFLKSTELAETFVTMVLNETNIDSLARQLVDNCIECLNQVRVEPPQPTLVTDCPCLLLPERQAVDLIMYLVNTKEMELRLSQVLLKLWEGVFSQDLASHLLGKLSLTRVFVALSSHHGDLEQVRVLLYKVAMVNHLALTQFVVATVTVWPPVLKMDEPKSPGLIAVIKYLVTKSLLELDSEANKQMLVVLQGLCEWSPTLEDPSLLAKNLIARLTTVIEESPEHGGVFELTKALHMLSVREGWMWFRDNVVFRYGLQTISNKYLAPKINKPVPPQLVCAIVRIIGDVVSTLATSAIPKDLTKMVKTWLMPIMNKQTGETSVCHCCFKVILELCPFQPSLLHHLQSWTGRNKTSVPESLLNALELVRLNLEKKKT